MKPAGEYFPKHNFPVVLALSEGVMPKLTAIDMSLILFLARTSKGWAVTGGAWSLDFVAARLDVSRSGLDKSIARLKRLDVIVSERTLTAAHYNLTDTFRKQCAEHLAIPRTIRIARLHTAVHELALLTGFAPDGSMLDIIARTYKRTGLTGRKLAVEVFNQMPANVRNRTFAE